MHQYEYRVYVLHAKWCAPWCTHGISMTVQRPELLTAAVDSGLAEHNADDAAGAGAEADGLVHAVAEGPGIGAAAAGADDSSDEPLGSAVEGNEPEPSVHILSSRT
jgi:hypothetical protein